MDWWSITSLHAWLYQVVRPTPVTSPRTRMIKLTMTRDDVEWLILPESCLSWRGDIVDMAARLRSSLLFSNKKFLCFIISKVIIRFCFSCSILLTICVISDNFFCCSNISDLDTKVEKLMIIQYIFRFLPSMIENSVIVYLAISISLHWKGSFFSIP